jgi:hypothetical protein
MPQTQRFGWSMAAAVAAVMALVFAALVSSWLGTSAEQDGKSALIEASRVARGLNQRQSGYSARNAARAAASVASISAAPCAPETKPAS